MILTPKKLDEYGTAIWGADWIAIVAKKLHIARKTIHRYKIGERGIPPSFVAAFDQIIENHLSILGRINDERRSDMWDQEFKG